MLITHLSEEESFHALGGVANRGIELRVWKAVVDSLITFPLDWIKAFKVKPLKPTHHLAQVVEKHCYTFIGSPYLDPLAWCGQKYLVPCEGFTGLPKLRVVAIGQLPPLALVQTSSKSKLTQVVGWLPLQRTSEMVEVLSLGVVTPTKLLSELLTSVCAECKVVVPQIWGVDDLKLEGPPVDVMYWHALSAAQICMPILREILLKRRCAMMRIKLLSSAGLEKMMDQLRELSVTARFRVRSEPNDSATHGDPVSSADCNLITLLFLPMFCAREFTQGNLGTPDRGTIFRVAQGDAQSSILEIVKSIGWVLGGLPGGLIEGCFRHTGLNNEVTACVLDRHQPVLQVASDNSTVLSVDSTIPHASFWKKLALHDNRGTLRSGQTLVRRFVLQEMLSAQGYSDGICSVISSAELSDDAMQQLLWETDPYHSMAAQTLMLYSFALPMLATCAKRIVMGVMQYDEVEKANSTRGARCELPAIVTVVPTVGSIPASSSVSFVSKQALVVEVDGQSLTIPAGTTLEKRLLRSSRPHKLLQQMKVHSSAKATRDGTVIYDGSIGSSSFRWQ
jgi:hypothetical protein